jgi:hypothetical protein
MRYPIITVLDRLSNLTINVYDFYIITYFQIHSILTNKANFGNAKMNITIDMTNIYKVSYRWQRPKNKANSNPIKPKTNPIKANTNPIRICFGFRVYAKYAGIYHPKGCLPNLPEYFILVALTNKS